MSQEITEDRQQATGSNGSDSAATVVQKNPDIELLETKGLPIVGSIRICGRSTARKNYTVNGVYAPVPGGHRSAAAYEKVLIADIDKKRFLFYSFTKKCWKINDSLGDDKGGFASLAAESCVVLPANILDKNWVVFDGKEGGHNIDLDVKCQWIQPPVEEAVSNTQNDAGSSSSSSASSDSSSSDDEASAVPVAKAIPKPPAAKLPAAKAKPPPWRLKPKSKICGKLLVHAGVRCACHFKPRAMCTFAKPAR